jgi:hypothetical protein
MTAPKKSVAKKAAPTTPPVRQKVKAASTEPDTATYKVTGPITIDGLNLEPGDSVDLTELQAYNLAGFVEPDQDAGEEAEAQ